MRAGVRVDQDQELLALGAANLGAGLSGGFSISASASRTPVAEAAVTMTIPTSKFETDSPTVMVVEDAEIDPTHP